MAMRLATFNLKDFFLPRRDEEKATLEAKVANIAKNLRRAHADVVALQEVGAPELVLRLVNQELSDLGYGAPVIGTPDKRGIRNVILSRLPVLWSQVHTAKAIPFPRLVEGDPEPYAGRIPLRRGVVHVRVDGGGSLGEVDVMTAHFKSNLPSPLRGADGREVADDSARGQGESAVRSLVQRAAEALYVRGLVDDVFRALPDHAVCVMGDLNDTIDSLPVRLLAGIDPKGRHVLQGAASSLAAEKRVSCFHGAAPSLIDHVLLSERLHRALHSCELYNEELRYHGPHVDDMAMTVDSDHALCVVELR